MKFAVVGVGAGVFHLHRPSLEGADITLVGACDVGAVVVLTPHPFHARVAIDSLAAGAHVLVEKPMAVQVAEADAMVDAAVAAGRLLAVNFQHRHRPEIRAARELIRSGQLGEMQRVQIAAVWTRTARYYDRAAWRGTWIGEGGGVLMNQAAHNLDLLCYLAGQPSRVVAWNQAMLHHVEVEDTAAALLQWPNGALGTLYVTTAQVGEPERIEIVGTGGVLEIGRDGLRVREAEVDLRTFAAECQLPFAAPELHVLDVELPCGRGDHAAVYANFLRAMRGAERLACDGMAGRESLELANALIFSAHRGCPVELPLDRAAYAHPLDELQAEHLELRSAWGTNVLRLDDGQVNAVAESLPQAPGSGELPRQSGGQDADHRADRARAGRVGPGATMRGWPLLADAIAHVQIKDALLADGSHSGGLSGPDGMATAAKALRRLLEP